MRLRLARSRLPRVALLLALVLLIPVTSLAIVTGSSAVSAWRERKAAIDIATDVATPSALMAARALVGSEGLASTALANAAEVHLSPTRLTELSGVDFAAALQRARPRVDADATLRQYPSLRADLAKLGALRATVDSGQATYRSVLTFFGAFTNDIDALWHDQLDHLRHDVTSTSHGTGVLADRISVLPTAFAMGTTAVDRIAYTNNLLRDPKSAAALKRLIADDGAYQADEAAVTDRFGPHASAAWRAMESDSAVARFQQVIDQTVTLALAGKPSPLASDLPAHALAFGDAARWLDDLQEVIQGASADVSNLAHDEEVEATGSFQLEVATFLLSVLFAAAAAVLLTRSVVRPLRRLARSARRVADGDFAQPAVPPSGPREVADTIAAVDDMTAVLAAVESFTVTLAEDPTSASLDVPLPGRTGLAMQTTLDRLRESVREAERQRALLHEVATHDGLTGLLNRNAALEAVSRELARGRRDHTTVMALFIDLDGLKNINDTHGHKLGDDAIRLAAQALRDAARTSDVVARLGGDEFLVAGGPVHSRMDVQTLADRVRGAVAGSTLEADQLSIVLQCSVGIATSEPGDNVESLIHKADQALYEAKKRGRNQTRWHYPAAVLVPAPSVPGD